MQTTSHFVGIELNPELFSDLFVNLYSYLKKNSIENILTFQNILSIHITLYYLEANLSKTEKQKIQEKIDNLDKEIIINI
jgi:lipopolysaccharide biosynthesis glycosyltransferase